MFDLIDELVDAIKKDDTYISFINANARLNDTQTLALLSRYQNLMEDYYRLKQYENYTSLDDIKNDIKNINAEIQHNEIIMNYYYWYHQLNDLLEDVTVVVFDHLSDELVFTRFEL